MAKVPSTQIDSVFRDIAGSSLTKNEMKVFSAWFSDAPTFSAGREILSQRTGLDESTIRKVMGELVDKGVLIPTKPIRTSKGQYVKDYIFGSIPQKGGEEIIDERGGESTVNEEEVLPPIHTNIHNNKPTKSSVQSCKSSFKECDVEVDLSDL
jgi:predicted transcriptional regulator